MKGRKLILRDIKKSAVGGGGQVVVYGFITLLKRKEMMIEILNSSSLIVNLSWQSFALDDRVAYDQISLFKYFVMY